MRHGRDHGFGPTQGSAYPGHRALLCHRFGSSIARPKASRRGAKPSAASARAASCAGGGAERVLRQENLIEKGMLRWAGLRMVAAGTGVAASACVECPRRTLRHGMRAGKSSAPTGRGWSLFQNQRRLGIVPAAGRGQIRTRSRRIWLQPAPAPSGDGWFPPRDWPCSSPAGGVTLTGFSKRLKARASRRSYRCDRTESSPRSVIWPATSHAAWPSDASPIARAAFGFDTAAPASQSPHATGSGAAVFRHPPNDSGPLAGPQMLSAGAQDTIRQNAPRMGAFDHWSRKLRSLREREGCFSLRSAFASI